MESIFASVSSEDLSYLKQQVLITLGLRVINFPHYFFFFLISKILQDIYIYIYIDIISSKFCGGSRGECLESLAWYIMSWYEITIYISTTFFYFYVLLFGKNRKDYMLIPYCYLTIQ